MFMMMVTMMKMMLTFVASERIFMNSSCVTPQLCSSDWQKSVKYSCILSYTSPSNVWKQPPLSNFFIKMPRNIFVPPSANGLSSQQLHPRGMLCLVLSVLPHQCYSSEVDSRQNYSRVHTSNLTEFVSASLWLHMFVSVILKSLDLRHFNDDSNTN